MVTLEFSSRPPGLLTAMTWSAICSSSEEPNSAAVRPVALILMTARFCDLVAANQLRLVGRAIRSDNLDCIRSGHHVRIGNNISITGRDNTGALAAWRNLRVLLGLLSPCADIIRCILVILNTHHARDYLCGNLLHGQTRGLGVGGAVDNIAAAGGTLISDSSAELLTLPLISMLEEVPPMLI